jgi:hypothetical protein
MSDPPLIVTIEEPTKDLHADAADWFLRTSSLSRLPRRMDAVTARRRIQVPGGSP